MTIREIEERDVREIITLRSQTDQNNYTIEELAAMGITEESVIERLRDDFKGWLCEERGRILGFAIGQKTNGEMWVVAVLPSEINRGIGSAVLARVEDWLFASGNTRIWLTTDVDTSLRAYPFYLKNGWSDDKIENGLRYMVKSREQDTI